METNWGKDDRTVRSEDARLRYLAQVEQNRKDIESPEGGEAIATFIEKSRRDRAEGEKAEQEENERRQKEKDSKLINRVRKLLGL